MITYRDLELNEDRALLRGAVRAVQSAHGLAHKGPCERQVPLGRRRADVVMAGEYLVTVELKLSDWKRALGQASLNQLWTDYSYIAIPESGRIDVICAAAREEGVGVITVDRGKGQVVAEARLSRVVDPCRRERLWAVLTQSG